MRGAVGHILTHLVRRHARDSLALQTHEPIELSLQIRINDRRLSRIVLLWHWRGVLRASSCFDPLGQLGALALAARVAFDRCITPRPWIDHTQAVPTDPLDGRAMGRGHRLRGWPLPRKNALAAQYVRLRKLSARAPNRLAVIDVTTVRSEGLD